MSRWSREMKIFVFAVVVIGGILVGVLLTASRSSTWFVIAAGILGSLLASITFAIVDAVLLGNPSRDARDALERLHAAVPILEQSRMTGVRAIKQKGDYEKEEWCSILTDARLELLLVGHALDKWCTDEIAPSFRSAIRQLTEARRPVQLLMLSESAKRVPALRAKDYKPRLQKTLLELKSLYGSLPVEARQYLHVHTLEPTVEMPYMAVGNEHVLITAPYPATTQSSDKMPALKVEAKSEIAVAIREDVRDLVRQHAIAVVLDASLE